MKARNKKTGREITILGISKEWGTVTFIAEGMLYQENLASGEWEIIDESEPVDWSSFRREAAKDILVGICVNWGRGFAGKLSDIPDRAIELADALIAKLKQE